MKSLSSDLGSVSLDFPVSSEKLLQETKQDRRTETERESFLSTDGAPEGGEDNKLAEREAEDKEGPHVDQLEPARIPMNEAWISIVHVNLQKALWKLLSPVV